MNSLKVLHTADWHLDNGWIDEARSALNYLINEAISIQPDVIIIAGDVVQSRGVRAESPAIAELCIAVSKMLDISPVIVIVGTDTHDGNVPEILSNIRGKFPIYVSSIMEQIIMYNDGALISADDAVENGYSEVPVGIFSTVPTPPKIWIAEQTQMGVEDSDAEISNRLSDILASFGIRYRRNWQNCAHAGIIHLQIGGCKIFSGQTLSGRAIEFSETQLDYLHADVICGGHIHIHQQVFSNAFYSGSLFPTVTGETDTKGFYVHDISSDHELTSQFYEIPTSRRFKIDIPLLSDPNIDIERLFSEIADLGIEISDRLSVHIQCWQDELPIVSPQQEEVNAKLLSAGYNTEVRLIPVSRTNERDQQITEAETVTEKLSAMAISRGEDGLSPGVKFKCSLLEAGDQSAIETFVDRWRETYRETVMDGEED